MGVAESTPKTEEGAKLSHLPPELAKQIHTPRGKIDLHELLQLQHLHLKSDIADILTGYSIFAAEEARLSHMEDLICHFSTQEYYEKSQQLSRALGSFLSLAIGDGFGHLYEFLPFAKGKSQLEALTA